MSIDVDRLADEVVRGAQLLIEKALAPVLAENVRLGAECAALAVRLADVEARAPVPGPAGRDGVDGKDGAPGRDGVDGKDGADGAPGRDGIDGLNGKDGEPGERGADGAPGADGMAGRDGVDGAPGRDGTDGKDADVEVIRGMVAEAVALIPTPRDGKDGKLPACKAWSDTVHFEGDVVTHRGALWQSRVPTGKEPPHSDWVCLAEAGRAGAGFVYRGTFSDASHYWANDVVVQGGSSWVAKVDEPGPCPGDGWGLMAGRGSKGQTVREKAPAAIEKPAPVSFDAGDDGVLALSLDDGQVLTVDLYPLLSRIAK